MLLLLLCSFSKLSFIRYHQHKTSTLQALINNGVPWNKRFQSIQAYASSVIKDHQQTMISTNITSATVKSFKEIPGPKTLPLIGNLWRYFPWIGQYDLERMDHNGYYNLKHYGKIVREEISRNHKIVHLFDPKDMESMFRQQRYPYRRSHRALLKYRQERPDKYQSGGIFPENGAEWVRLRDLFKHYFLLAKNINIYDSKLNTIAVDLVRYVRQIRDPNTLEVDDFQQYLYRWSLESICNIMLDDRIGCLEWCPNQNHGDQISDGLKMIEAGHKTIYAIMRTELYNSWQRRKTKDYRCLLEGQDMMAEVVDKYLQKRIADIKSGKDHTPDTILSKMIRDPKINIKDLFGMVMDFVLAGIDTTSITSGFVLYFLAKHVDIQERLREEVLRALDNSDYFKAHHFIHTPLLKACLKETLRLRPISIGVGRLATDDMIIGGFHIPKDTMIITQNQVSCRLEEYYNEPNQFKPERWFEENRKLRREHRFLYIPFGHGTRMCLGRRIAELEMYILVANFLRYFRMEYHHEEINQRTRLINTPDRPIKLRFIDRQS